ncbi:MAG: response regulator transcription factor [Candidatus Sericytochromatia bacterium]
MCTPIDISTAILVIEDDPTTRRLLEDMLRMENFDVAAVSHGSSAIQKLNTDRFDLILIDMNLPDIFGLDLFRQIQTICSTSCMFLTADSREADIVSSLDQGAEDYLIKPFKRGELLARIRKILARQKLKQRAESLGAILNPECLMFGPLLINNQSHEVFLGQESVILTAREFELFYLLASHPKRVYSRAEILDRIWADEIDVTERVVDVHIGKIRLKLGEKLPGYNCIYTVRGKGYRFLLPEESNLADNKRSLLQAET